LPGNWIKVMWLVNGVDSGSGERSESTELFQKLG
jgi:hypothetical protein